MCPKYCEIKATETTTKTYSNQNNFNQTDFRANLKFGGKFVVVLQNESAMIWTVVRKLNVLPFQWDQTTVCYWEHYFLYKNWLPLSFTLTSIILKNWGRVEQVECDYC